MSDLVGNSENRFSYAVAHMKEFSWESDCIHINIFKNFFKMDPLCFTGYEYNVPWYS